MDRERISYFEVMACVTRSIMLVNALHHYVTGATSAPNLAGLGLHLIPASLERAGRLLEWGTAPTPQLGVANPDPDRVRPDAADLLDGTVRFLHESVLPAIDDPVLRRGLRTTEAIVATAALRAGADPDADDERRRHRTALIAELAAAGIDTASGLEAAAVQVESDDAYRSLRPQVRDHLMTEIAAMRALAGPLNDLYGG
jgi:hypothetical protein